MDTPNELQYEGERPDAPTEEQKRKREDYRRKREKLSGVMGQYLLKGYKMLATTCEICGVINIYARRRMTKVRNQSHLIILTEHTVANTWRNRLLCAMQ